MNTTELKIKDLPECFAYLREGGYEPYFSNGKIEISKEDESEEY